MASSFYFAVVPRHQIAGLAQVGQAWEAGVSPSIWEVPVVEEAALSTSRRVEALKALLSPIQRVYSPSSSGMTVICSVGSEGSMVVCPAASRALHRVETGVTALDSAPMARSNVRAHLKLLSWKSRCYAVSRICSMAPQRR